MNIGFWNINCTEKNKKDLSDTIVDLVIEKQLDILVVAEATESVCTLFLTKINIKSPDKYHLVKSSKDRLKLFSRYKSLVFEDLSYNYVSSRWLAHKITIPNRFTINLFSVHFYSKTDWSDASLALECVNLARDIESIEHITNCSDTIVIGDFNMNPFESGLVAANGLNTTPDLEHAVQLPQGRRVDRRFYRYFYNPMWNYFGNYTQPFGTCYYPPSGHVSYQWHIFDQILLRPSFHQHLNEPYIEIVKELTTKSLLKKFARPNRKKYSDHLPNTLTLTI